MRAASKAKCFWFKIWRDWSLALKCLLRTTSLSPQQMLFMAQISQSKSKEHTQKRNPLLCPMLQCIKKKKSLRVAAFWSTRVPSGGEIEYIAGDCLVVLFKWLIWKQTEDKWSHHTPAPPTASPFHVHVMLAGKVFFPISMLKALAMLPQHHTVPAHDVCEWKK